MSQFGGFYKGEKKKKKQGQQSQSSNFAPVFVLPEVIGKGKKEKIR